MYNYEYKLILVHLQKFTMHAQGILQNVYFRIPFSGTIEDMAGNIETGWA